MKVVELFKPYNFYVGFNFKTQGMELYFKTLDSTLTFQSFCPKLDKFHVMLDLFASSGNVMMKNIFTL
jgi:hypothetical protein